MQGVLPYIDVSNEEPAWVSQLKQERSSLELRISKLSIFLNQLPQRLQETDLALLTQQMDLMIAYHVILTTRLHSWEDKNSERST